MAKKIMSFAKGLTRKQLLRQAHQEFPGVYKPKKKCSMITDILSMQSMIPPFFEGKVPIGGQLYRPPKVKKLVIDSKTDMRKVRKTMMPKLRYDTDRPPCRLQQYNEGEAAFKSPICLLFQMNSMSATQLYALKAKSAEKKMRLSFVRPSITNYLCRKYNLSSLESLCKGPMMVAYTQDPQQEPHMVKDALSLLEESKKLVLLSGTLQGQLYTPDQCRMVINTLPGRASMMSELVSLLQLPVRGVLSMLSSPMSTMARILEERGRQLQ